MKPRYRFLLIISLVCCAANIFWLFYPRFNPAIFTRINLAIAFIIFIQYAAARKQERKRNADPPKPSSFSEN